MAKLTKATAQAFRTLLDSRLKAAGRTVQDVAKVYRDNGSSVQRFVWDAWWSLPAKDRDDIIGKNNPNLTKVGGYYQDLKDSHIETMLNAALKDC